MMNQTLTSVVTREIRELIHDPWLLSLVTWIPVLLYVLLWSIFARGIATDLPIGVVDLDQSKTSRSLLSNYNASPSLAIVNQYDNVNVGVDALQAGHIYGLIFIPEDLEKKTLLGRPPQITAFVNTQFLLIGKIVNSALLSSQGTFTAKVEVMKNLASGPPVISSALSKATVINTQITPLFNNNTNYAQFLLSAILPAIWQILIVAATVLFFAAEDRRDGLYTWLDKSPSKAIAAKLLSLLLLFQLHGFLILWAMYILLGWPMHGSWQVLILAQFLTICASLSTGTLLYFLTCDAARGLSLAAAYTAPGLAFMGVTFPVTDMTLPAKVWRSFLPISHYIEIQFNQVNYGGSIISIFSELKYLLLFTLFLIPIVIRVNALINRNRAAQVKP